MVIQTIEQAPIEPFVVQQADVDLFDSLFELDSVVATNPRAATVRASTRPRDHGHPFMTSCSTLPEDSAGLEGVGCFVITDSEDSLHSRSLRRGSRRSSICSSTSSNSSVCSKSFGFNDGDESIVSCDDSVSRQHHTDESPKSHSSRRKHRRSTKHHKSKKPSGDLAPVRHVSFTSSVTVRCIPDLDDFSVEEKSQVWYNEEELLQIKHEAQQLIQQAKDRTIPHTANELRGLHMTQKRQRRSAWVMALACVLDEQKRQLRNGVPKDRGAETLAKLYKSFAFSAVQIAQKVGQEDSLAAMY